MPRLGNLDLGECIYVRHMRTNGAYFDVWLEIYQPPDLETAFVLLVVRQSLNSEPQRCPIGWYSDAEAALASCMTRSTAPKQELIEQVPERDED